MKRYFLVSIFVLNLLGTSLAQTKTEVFFRFADKEVTKDEVMYVHWITILVFTTLKQEVLIRLSNLKEV